ncbi:MAG: hypothetical protein FWH44_01120, partial [Methanomassiliicoccaceae archaeon]|nr:hypothetical protein [Methanomassiliicoccaceae archaeon]
GQSANGHNGNGHNGNGHNGGGSNDNGQSNDVTAAPGNGLPYADGNIRIEYLDHGTYRFIALNGEEDTIWEFPVAGMLGLTYVGPVLTIDLNPYTIYMLVYKTNVYYLCTMDNTVEKIM